MGDSFRKKYCDFDFEHGDKIYVLKGGEVVYESKNFTTD